MRMCSFGLLLLVDLTDFEFEVCLIFLRFGWIGLVWFILFSRFVADLIISRISAALLLL